MLDTNCGMGDVSVRALLFLVPLAGLAVVSPWLCWPVLALLHLCRGLHPCRMCFLQSLLILSN